MKTESKIKCFWENVTDKRAKMSDSGNGVLIRAISASLRTWSMVPAELLSINGQIRGKKCSTALLLISNLIRMFLLPPGPTDHSVFTGRQEIPSSVSRLIQTFHNYFLTKTFSIQLQACFSLAIKHPSVWFLRTCIWMHCWHAWWKTERISFHSRNNISLQVIWVLLYIHCKIFCFVKKCV